LSRNPALKATELAGFWKRKKNRQKAEMDTPFWGNGLHPEKGCFKLGEQHKEG